MSKRDEQRERGRLERERIRMKIGADDPARVLEPEPDTDDPLELLEAWRTQLLRDMKDDADAARAQGDHATSAAIRARLLRFSSLGKVRVETDAPWKGLPPASLAGLTAEQLAQLADGRPPAALTDQTDDADPDWIPGLDDDDEPPGG
jgi:hypothetical protein